MNFVLPISVRLVSVSFVIEGRVADFNILPPSNPLSKFENDYAWSDIQDGFDKAKVNLTILLDKFVLPEDMCQALSDRIRNRMASIVLDGSFNCTSPIGPVRTSAVILAPSTNVYHKPHWVKGCNWVTGPSSQSAYRNELAGVIASLTILDIIVRYNSITEGEVTFALDGLTAMEEAGGDWPLSFDQKCFNYLQIIRAWIKLSPVTFTFRHVKGHQTNKVAYNQLDWWGRRNKDVDKEAKNFLFSFTEGLIADIRHYIQPTLHLENEHFHKTVQNLPASAGTHCIPIYMAHVSWPTGMKKTIHPGTRSVSSGRNWD